MDDKKLSDLLTTAYDAAPANIRTFIDEGRIDDFMLDLQISMKLHVDVADTVQNQILLTLLGVFEPTELPDSLKDAGLSEEEIVEVLNSANKSIFLPLRDELRSASSQSETLTTPAPSPVRTSLASVPAPLRSEPVVTQPAIVTPVPVVQKEVAAITPLSTPAPSTAPTSHHEPSMRTMAHDIEAMHDGHAPDPVPYHPTPTAPAPISAAPTPPPASITTPSTAPVLQSVSTLGMAAPVTPPKTELPPHPPRTFGNPDPKEVTATLQKYGIDPYREVVD